MDQGEMFQDLVWGPGPMPGPQHRVLQAQHLYSAPESYFSGSLQSEEAGSWAGPRQPRPCTNPDCSCSSAFLEQEEEIQRVPSLTPSREEEEERRAARKRQRNRVAAAKCRRKKLEKIARLESEADARRDRLAALSARECSLQSIVSALRFELWNHLHSGCLLPPDAVEECNIYLKAERKEPGELPH